MTYVDLSLPATVNDRFDMEVVFPVLPKAKEGPYDSDSDSDDDNTVAHALFISATADVSGDAMKTLVDYDSDDDEGTLDIPLAVTTAKRTWKL